MIKSNLNPNAKAWYPRGLNPNAPEYIPSHEALRAVLQPIIPSRPAFYHIQGTTGVSPVTPSWFPPSISPNSVLHVNEIYRH